MLAKPSVLLASGVGRRENRLILLSRLLITLLNYLSINHNLQVANPWLNPGLWPHSQSKIPRAGVTVPGAGKEFHELLSAGTAKLVLDLLSACARRPSP